MPPIRAVCLRRPRSPIPQWDHEKLGGPFPDLDASACYADGANTSTGCKGVSRDVWQLGTTSRGSETSRVNAGKKTLTPSKTLGRQHVGASHTMDHVGNTLGPSIQGDTLGTRWGHPYKKGLWRPYPRFASRLKQATQGRRRPETQATRDSRGLKRGLKGHPPKPLEHQPKLRKLKYPPDVASTPEGDSRGTQGPSTQATRTPAKVQEAHVPARRCLNTRAPRTPIRHELRSATNFQTSQSTKHGSGPFGR